MTKKDLFDGLNHIDEKIIEEAAEPVRIRKKSHKKLKKMAISTASIAAILTVAVLGTEVVRLGNRVNELESAKSDAGENTQKSNNAYAGVKSGDKLGEYILASNYEDLYYTVKSAQKKDKEMVEYDSVVNQFFLPMIKQKFDEPKDQLEKEINNQKSKLERIKKAYINGAFELKEYNEEKHIVEKTIVELEEKLNITDCTEELKFTPKDILLKRDIDFINKIKLDKEYQEKTKTLKDYTREEKADLIMRYVEDIELTLVGNEVILKQINFRDSICKPCQELYDKGYIDITKPMILGNVLGSVRFSNYLPDKEVCEIIMRLQQYYDVHFTEATYYLQKQMFYFNFAEDNSAIVRVFPLEDYYKLDPNNKMEKYRFGILYINEEDKFEMQDIDTAFDYIPDESNDSVIYMKEPVPISVGVKPVKFCEDNTEEKN